MAVQGRGIHLVGATNGERTQAHLAPRRDDDGDAGGASVAIDLDLRAV
jgi:hypothetical protein